MAGVFKSHDIELTGFWNNNNNENLVIVIYHSWHFFFQFNYCWTAELRPNKSKENLNPQREFSLEESLKVVGYARPHRWLDLADDFHAKSPQNFTENGVWEGVIKPLQRHIKCTWFLKIFLKNGCFFLQSHLWSYFRRKLNHFSK